jgi:hypothetical protein
VDFPNEFLPNYLLIFAAKCLPLKFLLVGAFDTSFLLLRGWPDYALYQLGVHSLCKHFEEREPFVLGSLANHRNVAVTHAATKMLRIIWHMLHENRLYNEKKEQLYQNLNG